MKSRFSAAALAALATIYVVWGSTYLAIRVVVTEMPPFLAAGARFVAAGLVLGALATRTDRGRGRPTGRQFAEYAFVGLLLLAFGNGCVMWAEQHLESGITALIVATVPLWVTLFESLASGRFGWRPWLGVALGLAGVAIVARPEAGLGLASLWPATALTLASVAWTAGTLYAQSRPAKLGLFSAAAIEMVSGGLLLLALAWFAGEDPGRFLGASARAWSGLVYLAVFGSLIGFTAFAYCVEELPAPLVATYAYVNPVVALALGALVLGERLSSGVLTGGALILAAVVVTVASSARPEPPRDAEPS